MYSAFHSKLLQAIFNHAEQTPDKIALISSNGNEVCYAELSRKILEVASYLQNDLGLNQGDYILLAAQKEVEFVYLYFAAHLIGVVNVVIDPTSTAIDFVVETISPKRIFGLKREDAISFEDICFSKMHLNAPLLSEGDIADVMFTTGTTSNPKGVCLSHYNIASSALNINGFIGNTVEDIEVLGLPLSHSFGLGRLRCTLLSGATLILLGNFANLKIFFDTIERYRVTGFGMVPAVWRYIKMFSGTRIGKYSGQIRYIEIGSAPMAIENKKLLIELFPNTRICMHYGLTEASRAFFMEFHENKDNLETIGRPASKDVQAIIMGESGKQAKIGEDGEICVKGNMVMSRYLLPEDNTTAFWGPYFRTGDYGYEDENGLFYMVGRKKELINVGGEKVSPVRIESAIMSLGIEDCAVIAVNDTKGLLGEVPKAYMVRGNSNLTIEQIKEKIRPLLVPYQRPREYEWVESIPKTSSGKVQRLLLKKQNDNV